MGSDVACDLLCYLCVDMIYENTLIRYCIRNETERNDLSRKRLVGKEKEMVVYMHMSD
jgi:hypothetical protein